LAGLRLTAGISTAGISAAGIAATGVSTAGIATRISSRISAGIILLLITHELVPFYG